MVTGGYALEDRAQQASRLRRRRFLGVDVSTGWDLATSIPTPGGGVVVLPAQGSSGKDTDLWDGIIGLRGR